MGIKKKNETIYEAPWYVYIRPHINGGISILGLIIYIALLIFGIYGLYQLNTELPSNKFPQGMPRISLLIEFIQKNWIYAIFLAFLALYPIVKVKIEQMQFFSYGKMQGDSISSQRAGDIPIIKTKGRKS